MNFLSLDLWANESISFLNSGIISKGENALYFISFYFNSMQFSLIRFIWKCLFFFLCAFCSEFCNYFVWWKTTLGGWILRGIHWIQSVIQLSNRTVPGTQWLFAGKRGAKTSWTMENNFTDCLIEFNFNIFVISVLRIFFLPFDSTRCLTALFWLQFS